MIRTTLTDAAGVTHDVTLPDIPASFPGTGSVTPRAACGAGYGQSMPAALARTLPVTPRPVDCEVCLRSTS